MTKNSNRNIILIGGGENGREGFPYETENIDKKIVELTNKENPTFVFLGVNTNFSDSYYKTMTKIYGDRFHCQCVHLSEDILKNYEKAKNLINSADIIYIGGGSTEILMQKLKKYNALDLLINAYNSGCIMVGLCSGAIFWCTYGVSLRLNKKKTYKNSGYFKIHTSGILPIFFCPHYNIQEKRKTVAIDMVSMKHAKKIIGCDNCASLFISNENYYKIIRSSPQSNVKILKISNNYVVEEILPDSGYLKNL